MKIFFIWLISFLACLQCLSESYNYLMDCWNVTMIIFCAVFMINNLEENMLV